jgi:hypothetical protein
MKNAIIINGTVYELVPNDTGKYACETCALRNICFDFDYALCITIYDAEGKDHFIKQQKGGDE